MLNDINVITISGTLLEDVKKISLNNSDYTKYALKVIVNDYDTIKKEKRATTFLVEYFSKLEIKELLKGAYVVVSGKMLTQKYTKNGKDTYINVIHCETLKPKAKTNSTNNNSNENNEDSPWG